MNEERTRLLLIIPLMTAVLALYGCSKKSAPADSREAAPAKDTASPEKQAEAAGATGKEQGEPVFDAKSIMSSVDKNGDGKVSRAEYYAIWKDKSVAERNFKMIDRNGDGVLSADEFNPKLGTK